ncbi:MAG: hypothetical protein K6T83_11035 [Alicyclobacillus sp.]|nr:hypothetical protein [Alicyclobacillus sp.]
MGEHRAEGKTNRLAYSDQYWIVANSLEGLEFTPLTVVEESMDSPFAVRSPDGTVTKRIVRDLVFDALSHGAEAPFLFARVESQSMFLVGWWYSGEKHAIVAHDDSEALACYYSLVDENKCEEIYEDARGMSEREFREQFVEQLSPSMYIDIADDEGTTTSTVGGSFVKQCQLQKSFQSSLAF